MYLVVGSGAMAEEYVKPLVDMNVDFLVVGRSEESANRFSGRVGVKAISGGLKNYLSTEKKLIDGAFVTVGVESLYTVTKQLIEYGVLNILVEKPAAITISELKELVLLSQSKKASVYVAYNRRFFSSVLEAEKIIKKDGGVTSFNFEVTEWGHVIGPLEKADMIKEAWFLANTTHVADLAFFLGGNPIEMSTYVSDSISWHPTGTNFSGAGKANSGALFSYSGNWQAPGRWAVEVMTKKSRLILKPMEQLQIQKVGSINIEQVPLNDTLDKKYKPGLYAQISAFLNAEFQRMCSISEQLNNTQHYMKMAGYK
ncbi:MAG: Gfo/Idh/MocA family oxidoreductase [Cellvibrionaceae bacterium]